MKVSNMKSSCDSENLIDKYGNMIYRIAIGYLKNKDDAEDIVQEVFIKYIEYMENNMFNDEEHEKCWIIRVTVNLCCNHLKYQKNTALIVAEQNLNTYLNLDEKENYILETIEKLEEKYRIIFDLFYLRDLKISEISKILNISEANVKVRLKRARDKLREMLQLGDGEFNERFKQ